MDPASEHWFHVTVPDLSNVEFDGINLQISAVEESANPDVVSQIICTYPEHFILSTTYLHFDELVSFASHTVSKQSVFRVLSFFILQRSCKKK
jgi:hypothetical protein